MLALLGFTLLICFQKTPSKRGSAMSILLAFTPFILFAILERVGPLALALAAGAIAAAVLSIRDWRQTGTLKLLDAGAFVLFGGLALLVFVADVRMSVMLVRVVVDSGLVLIAAGSLAVGRPFTLAYTPNAMPAEPTARRIFMRTHAIVTLVWTLAFLTLVGADALIEWAPEVPPVVGIGLIVAAFFGAIRFSKLYPERVRAQATALLKARA
jgi:hypothetical protein